MTLRTIRLGESDRIVTIMTEHHGKVRAVAKGVRKTKSRFGARVEPIGHASLLFYEGRDLDIITQAESLDHFRAIREDLDRMAHASSMLEAVDQVAQDREPNPHLYRLLLRALTSLDGQDSAVMVPAFFWKLLSLEGFRPVLEHCANCGSTGDLVAFDLEIGGVLCRSCRQGAPISGDALLLMRRILGGDLAAALNEPSGSVVHEVEQLATRAMEHHIERRLRSVHLLDRA